jgi:hypothetical protein
MGDNHDVRRHAYVLEGASHDEKAADICIRAEYMSGDQSDGLMGYIGYSQGIFAS